MWVFDTVNMLNKWTCSKSLHHCAAASLLQDEEEQHEVSELMVFAATFVLLHIAKLGCTRKCLNRKYYRKVTTSLERPFL